jgi:hypothetical protein
VREKAAQKITEATCAEKENSGIETQAGGAKEAANKDQARLTSPNQCLQCFDSCFHLLHFSSIEEAALRFLSDSICALLTAAKRLGGKMNYTAR